MTKARLICLVLLASLFACLLGGMSSGGGFGPPW
jgi:hypothetical protein